MPTRLLEITEHPRLATVSGIGPELKAREPKRLYHEHGCAVADPAEPDRCALPPRDGIFWDCDHGQVSAVAPLGIDPPRLGLHIDFGILADVQPYPNSRGSGHDVRSSEYPAWHDQIPRSERATFSWPPVNYELGNPPRLSHHPPPLLQAPGFSALRALARLRSVETVASHPDLPAPLRPKD
jgi:hypothetical protein